MDMYRLNVPSNNIGGYFSSEQLELLSIVQCSSFDELISFMCECEQLNGVFSEEDLLHITSQDLEEAKRSVFKSYQDTLVPHDSEREVMLDNALSHLGISSEDITVVKKVYSNASTERIGYIREYIKNKYPANYEELFRQSHRFV